MRAVLTFHGVDGSGSVLSVRPDTLASLVAGLRRSGHAIVPLIELLDGPAHERRVALTFDDGFRSVAQAALPVLSEAGVTATLFLVTGAVGSDNRWPGQPPGMPVFPMLDWDGVEALHGAGWQIESHGASHADLRTLGDAALDEDLGRAQAEIERRLGRRPDVFAYPYGYLDERVVACARRHHAWAVTTRMASLDAASDPHRVPRIDAYYLQPAWLHGRLDRVAGRLWLAGRRRLRALRYGESA